jgi:hypothetical protein
MWCVDQRRRNHLLLASRKAWQTVYLYAAFDALSGLQDIAIDLSHQLSSYSSDIHTTMHISVLFLASLAALCVQTQGMITSSNPNSRSF